MTGCHGSPTAIPRWRRWASPRRWPPSAGSRPPRSPTTSAATARASSCRPRGRPRSSPRPTALPAGPGRCSACTWSAPGWASSSPRGSSSTTGRRCRRRWRSSSTRIPPNRRRSARRISHLPENPSTCTHDRDHAQEQTPPPGTHRCRITKESPKAMSVSVSMPQLGESVTEGTVTRWLKKEGERVEADEPLLEVSTDKVDTEIPSPVSGILRGITVAEDETVEVGAELAVIDETGGEAAEAPAPAAEAAPAQAPPAEAPEYPQAAQEFTPPAQVPEYPQAPAAQEYPPAAA